jgi:hypothetical protein
MGRGGLPPAARLWATAAGVGGAAGVGLTPAGGLVLILGWLLLAAAALFGRRQ